MKRMERGSSGSRKTMTDRIHSITSWLFITAIVAVLSILACSSTKEVEQMSVEKRFEHAMSLFKSEDYLDAYEDFRIVTLQYSGSSVADDAQFHMGVCRFRREEYILAAYEYDVLIRTMPTSKFVAQARYQRALCYYHMSPTSYLDQTYTHQAIDEFQSFIEYHPTDSLVTDAEGKITELNTRLAQKEYENGITYIHLEYYKSAVASFDHVLEKYHDTPYAEQAQLKKAEVMVLRKRYTEARTEIEKFFTKYPNSQLKADAEQVRKDILSRIPQKPAEEPKGPAAVSNHSDGSVKE
jgi:outer membrane protein assembly factor BamD